VNWGGRLGDDAAEAQGWEPDPVSQEVRAQYIIHNGSLLSTDLASQRITLAARHVAGKEVCGERKSGDCEVSIDFVHSSKTGMALSRSNFAGQDRCIGVIGQEI
jgi:hypothetical protein